MNVILQREFKNNPKMYDYLKQNSYYFKQLDRGTITFKQFSSEMKEKYKQRMTDKISNAVDHINLVSSVLEVLK